MVKYDGLYNSFLKYVYRVRLEIIRYTLNFPPFSRGYGDLFPKGTSLPNVITYLQN